MATLKPKVVVVMPAYNAQHTIEKTWREVVAHEVVDLVIVVDDASQDETMMKAQGLDRRALVTTVLPSAGRHVLLEVAAAIAGVEAKILRADLNEVGVTSRDRIPARSGHPVRALLDRVARERRAEERQRRHEEEGRPGADRAQRMRHPHDRARVVRADAPREADREDDEQPRGADEEAHRPPLDRPCPADPSHAGSIAMQVWQRDVQPVDAVTGQ